MRPAKTKISLSIRPIWSESSLSAWRKLGSLATNWAHCEDSDQTGGKLGSLATNWAHWEESDQMQMPRSGRMPRLIWVFAGRTVILLVLLWSGSLDQTAIGGSHCRVVKGLVRGGDLCSLDLSPQCSGGFEPHSDYIWEGKLEWEKATFCLRMAKRFPRRSSTLALPTWLALGAGWETESSARKTIFISSVQSRVHTV